MSPSPKDKPPTDTFNTLDPELGPVIVTKLLEAEKYVEPAPT